jgi:hypothetical protein
MNQSERDAQKERDALFSAFMADQIDHEEFFRLDDELAKKSPMKEREIVNAMANLCVALQKRDEIATQAEQSKREADEAQALADEAQARVDALQEKVETLRLPEKLPDRTEGDIRLIREMMSANPKMVWYTQDSYPSQCVLCGFRKIRLPRFSSSNEFITIDIDEETKFIRLPRTHESWAVFGNTENGKMVGVRQGSMTW